MCGVLTILLLQREKSSHGQDNASIPIQFANYSSLSQDLWLETSYKWLPLFSSTFRCPLVILKAYKDLFFGVENFGVTSDFTNFNKVRIPSLARTWLSLAHLYSMPLEKKLHGARCVCVYVTDVAYVSHNMDMYNVHVVYIPFSRSNIQLLLALFLSATGIAIHGPCFSTTPRFSVLCVSFFLPICCTSFSMYIKVVDSIQTGWSGSQDLNKEVVLTCSKFR